jgi:Ca-activated chloride channel family protein
MNLLWHAEYNTDLTTVNRSIFYSPIVICMWNSTVQKYNVTSLQDLYNLCIQPNSPIKLAHTDPRSSNSGYCAMVMEVAAAAHKNSSQLVYADLLNSSVQAWVKGFESRAVEYGTSTGYLMTSMVESGPSGINAAFTYENLVASSASEAKAWGDSLVAIYPSEGMIYSDHPYCILNNAPWMVSSPILQTIASKFINNFLTQKSIEEIATENGFRVYDPSITLPNSTFNAANGVQYNISAYPQLSVPTDAAFIQHVSDLWLMSRPAF